MYVIASALFLAVPSVDACPLALAASPTAMAVLALNNLVAASEVEPTFTDHIIKTFDDVAEQSGICFASES